MSSKPSSQPASHRSGRSIGAALDAGSVDPAADDPSRDGARSEASGGVADMGDAEEVLTRSLIKRGLLDLSATSDRANFAFTRLELQGQGIKTLEGDLASYPELRYVNLGNNEISDLSGLAVLPRLLALQVPHNHLSDLDSLLSTSHNQLQLLQADHSQKGKKLASTGARKPLSSLSLNFPSLFALTLSNNKIASIVRPEDAGAEEFTRDAHPSLQVLDCAFNQLASLDAIGCFPSLRVLNLQSNLLENLKGIEGLQCLEKLNVSDNRLVSLLADLPRLAALPKLTHLILAGNPLLLEELERNLAAAIEAGTALESQQSQGSVDMISEILIALPRLLFLDGKRITAAARKTADLLKKERAADLERRTEEENLAKKLAAEEEEAEKKARAAEEAAEAEENKEEKDSDEEEENKEDEENKEEKGEEEEGDAEKSMDSAAADAEADADADADAAAADDGEAGAGDEDAQGDDDDADAGAEQSFDDQAGAGDEPAGGDEEDGGEEEEEEEGEEGEEEEEEEEEDA